MARVRPVLGSIAGALMLLSAVPHGVLGWPAMRDQLAGAGVAGELLDGVRMGWLFGSVMMAGAGVALLLLFRARQRDARASLTPALALGAAYAGFGVWAFVASGLEPFWFAFIVPGVLACVAALDGRGG
jgi:TRAP-type C4-dicarboxylate transport system permease small subunit